MSKSPWTWLVTAAALTLPFGTMGCSSPCDDLEEICDGCPGELQGQCMSTKNACTNGISGPVGGDLEDDCCEDYIDVYEGQC